MTFAKSILLYLFIAGLTVSSGTQVQAHPMESTNAGFVQSVDGPAPGPFLYLGAKHMVTGYDHLLFLVGDVSVNAYIIDAIIGLSVVYKGFENIQGFERVFKIRPDTRVAVLVFGLFHGLGLATKLQEFTVSQNGLVANILSFNVGVEIGQILALVGVVALLGYWRTRPSFASYSFATNTALMTGGFVLAGIQLIGFVLFT